MSTTTKQIPGTLPREMMQHTYPNLFRIEESHWWHRGRRKIIGTFVQQICRNFSGEPRILDVGCGTGANLKLLSQFGKAEGVDVSTDALEFCKQRGLDVHLGAAEQLPFEENSFDLVTALDVVEHLDDDVAGLKEMRRVLKPNGRILLFVPTFMFLWGVQDDVSHHRRRYRLPELRRVVKQAGFEVERTSYANITFFAPILLIRKFMAWTGLRASTENNINISALNGVFTRILAAEGSVLRHMNLPFGVSGLCVARVPDSDSGRF